MANIATYLQKILEAVYGEEVRGSIHDALKAMNEESSDAMIFAKTAKDSAANSAAAAKESETIAEQKADDANKAAIAAQKSETGAKASEAVIAQKTNEATTAAEEAKDAQQKAAGSEAIATQKALDAENSANAVSLSEANVAAAEERVSSLKSEAEETAAQITSDKETVEAAKQETIQNQEAAKKSADAAETARADAESFKNDALEAKKEVDADALAAQTARDEAEKAKTESQGFSKSASDSAILAAESAASAKQYSGKPPKIDPDTKTWWIWHADSGENGEYVDTHLSSEIAGPPGTSITNITLKSGNHAPGTIDTYTIEMSDGNSFEFTVRNGHDGEGSGDVLGRSFDLTIPKDSWVDGQATVENEQFLAMATYKYLIGSDESCRDEYDGCGVKAKDITTSGQITFICNTDPTRDLVVNVLRFELSAVG